MRGDMEQRQIIAQRLRAARLAALLTQEQAAERLGWKQPTLSEIEAGRRSVRAEELILFADLYGVPVVDLVEVAP